MTKENWPSWISENENSEYLERIKNEYIISTEFEREDPFYEKVADIWHLTLNLDVNGQKSRVFIKNSNPLLGKIEDFVSTSKDFILTEDERPMQYGRYVYERKSDQRDKKGAVKNG